MDVNASNGLTLREPQNMTFHVAAIGSHTNPKLSTIKFGKASAEVEFAKGSPALRLPIMSPCNHVIL